MSSRYLPFITIFCLVFGGLLLASCQQGDDDFEILQSWMTGSFSSEQQAAADSNFFDIRLEMARIWPERHDGCWLYVEQAAAGHLDRPYRQRVYHLRYGDDGTFSSEIFSFAAPLRFAGAWREEAPLASLSPDSLAVRVGGAVILSRQPDGSFTGTTVDDNCQSSLRGATYATTEVRILADRLESWDRGFDAAGEQVWGATTGGYVFIRKSGP